VASRTIFQYRARSTAKSCTKKTRVDRLWQICYTRPIVGQKGTALLTTERRQAIADRIRRQSSVRLRELSEMFQVSDSTIRRDLEYLETQGLLKRTYGGAVLAQGQPDAEGPVLPLNPQATPIAAAAAALVTCGETVYLGTGSLALAVAHQLARRSGLTVITNTLDVAAFLAHHSTLSVILTGGQLERPGGALVGHVAQLALNELRADKAILDVAGLSVPDGITGESLSSAQFTRTVIERMPEVIVVVEEQKWGRVGPAFLAPLEAIDRIVTGQRAPPAMVWDLSQLGIQIIQA
jgi:DeoR/GlpR family transcriptional regulator of sugar metabolism